MIYCYDNAFVDDLKKSFNPANVPNPVVKVIDPENVIGLAAQMQDDNIRYPIVAVTRSEDLQVDTDRTNFSRIHKGVVSVIDPDTNELYYERAIPITLSYSLTVLTTSTAELDEIVRELMFKYSSMYFITFTLPYECKRKVRFGVTLDTTSNIDRSSASGEYLSSGQLYQAIVPLRCEGCVLVSYTPAKLRRIQYDIDYKDISDINK